MKIHHIGIVCDKENMKNFFFIPKKKFIYTDRHQNNKLVIGKNKFNNLWFEFILPLNNKSTVKNFLKKKGPSIHHIAYYVNNLNNIKKRLRNKKGYIFVNSFKINLPCFGGVMETVFYYNNNIFIEFLSKEKN